MSDAKPPDTAVDAAIDGILAKLESKIASNVQDALRGRPGLRTFGSNDNPRGEAKAKLKALMVAAEIQRTLDAFTQLKQNRIAHTLTVDARDWMREIDFMDMEMHKQLATLTAQQPTGEEA